MTRALEPAQRGRQTEGKTSKRAPGHSSTLDDRSGSLVVFYQYWRGSLYKDRYAGPSPPFWGQQSPMHPRQHPRQVPTTIYTRGHSGSAFGLGTSEELRCLNRDGQSLGPVAPSTHHAWASCALLHLGKLCPTATLEITCTSPGDSCESSRRDDSIRDSRRCSRTDRVQILLHNYRC